MWLVFLVAAPQLRTTYEFRICFDDETCTWTSIILPCNGPPACFDGDRDTSALRLFERIFTALGSPEFVPSLN